MLKFYLNVLMAFYSDVLLFVSNNRLILKLILLNQCVEVNTVENYRYILACLP